MKIILIAAIIFTYIFSTNHAQEKQLKVPSFLIKTPYLKIESYQMLRWIKFTKEQRLAIYKWHLKSKNDLTALLQKKNAAYQLKVKNITDKKEKSKLKDLYTKEVYAIQDKTKNQVVIKLRNIATKKQIKDYQSKMIEALKLKKEIEESLISFQKAKQKIGALSENLLGLQATFTKHKCLYYPEVWAITRTPLSKKEVDAIYEWIGHTLQIEFGFYLGTQTEEKQLDGDTNYFNIYLKKDFGTKDFNKKISTIISTENHIKYQSLLKLYKEQKKSLLGIYTKYGETTKIQFRMSPQKILELK